DCYIIARSPALASSRRGDSSKPLVVWEGELQTLTSMSIINRELGRALAAQADIDIVFRPDEVQPDPLVASDERYEPVRKRIDRTPLESDVFVRHPCGDPSFERPETSCYVHIQPWEYGSLPLRWVEAMKPAVDEVWCPSTYVRNLYLDAGF